MRKSNRLRVLQEAKKVTLSEKEFWLSFRTKKYFNEIVLCILKRYKAQDRVSLRVIYDKPSITGYTDGRSITLNSNCAMFSPLKTRLEKFKAFSGMCLHEIAHCLYTDTELVNAVTNNLLQGTFNPIVPRVDLSEIESLISSSKNSSYKARVFAYMFHDIWNILEDGYIEYRFLDEYPQPTFNEALMSLRKLHATSIPSFEEMLLGEQDEKAKIVTIKNMLLSYCKYGLIKCEKISENDERILALKRCIPIVDRLNRSNNNTVRIQLVYAVIKELEEYIIPHLKDIDSNQDAENSMQQMSQGEPQQPQQMDSSNSSSGSSNQKPIAKDEDESEEDESKNGSSSSANNESGENNQNETSSSKDSKESEDNQDEESSSSGSGSKKEDDKENEADNSSSGSSSEEGDENEEKGNSGKSSDEEAGEDNAGSTAATKENENGGSANSGNISDYDDSSALEDALQKLESESKEDKAAKKLDDQDSRELENEYGDCNIRRAPYDDRLPDIYNKLYPEIQKTSKAIIKAYQQKMKDRAMGGISKGLYNGSRLESRSYYRYDKRIFSKKNAPTEIEKLAIALVIDESGSMAYEKIDTARMFALILHDVCTNLGIEIMITGHTDHQQIYDYCKFGGSYDGKDKYRLLTITDRGGDSAYHAFKMALDAIERKTVAENKMVIMVSDGLPNYGREELKMLSKTAKAKKVNVVAASIGCDIDRMKDIYGENTLNIEDINMLPKTLMNCIKRYLD